MNKGMEKELAFLKNVVEGKIDIKIFEKELYENNKIQEVLDDESINWKMSNSLTPYYYLLEIDYNSISGKLNAQGALELFLNIKGIDFIVNKQFSDEYDLILDTQPKYLDVDEKFIKKYIFPKEKGLSKTEVKKYMKGKFK